jgi:UDP-glucose:tetrahydrobiopterin glucosyltransferase
MRVALVAPLVAPIREPQVGGSQAFLADLARGLLERGHDVALYAASGSDVPDVPVIDVGIDHRGLSATVYRLSAEAPAEPGAAERAFDRVYSGVAESRYDVVHNHAFDAPAITLAAGLSSPVVHTLHLPPDEAVAAAVRQAARADAPPAVAGVSRFQAAAWSRIVSIDAILPPNVPTGRIEWSPTRGEGALFAGRLSPEKGATEAIEIARLAGIPIAVYGDAYDGEYAREEIDPLRDASEVAIRPAVARSSLWHEMARAAVVLCPAGWDEPFGMVAAEAQACGTPVVAFDRGAIGEVIVDRVTGSLVPPGDIRAAAEAVRGSSRLSREECRAHAERDLDLERSLDAHEELYRRVARPGAAVRG